jgi:hypothetical protein
MTLRVIRSTRIRNHLSKNQRWEEPTNQIESCTINCSKKRQKAWFEDLKVDTQAVSRPMCRLSRFCACVPWVEISSWFEDSGGAATVFCDCVSDKTAAERDELPGASLESPAHNLSFHLVKFHVNKPSGLSTFTVVHMICFDVEENFFDDIMLERDAGGPISGSEVGSLRLGFGTGF